MHSQFKIFNTVLIALCVAQGVLSIPLEIEPIAAASTPAEQANEAHLTNAQDLANKNILKMEHVLNNPTAPGHQDMIDAAFGKDPSLNMDEVKDTVSKLKTGKVPVNLATAKGNVIAYTNYDDSTNPMTPTHVDFGKKYYAKGTSDDARAATLVHEATHKLKDTGDYIKDNKILHGGDPEETSKTGYATGMEPKKTAADLNNDANWKKMRDGHAPTFGDPIPATKDMHKNAESYGQFSAMCGAAVSDAAVGLRRRAMAAGNWDEAATYLVRRQACSIRNRPASAKKAAAAKTAEGKATTASKSKSKSVTDAKSLSKSKSKSTAGGLRKKTALSKVAGGGVTKKRLGGSSSATKKRLGGSSAAVKKSALSRSKVSGKGAKSLLKGAKSVAGAGGKGSVKSRVAKGAVKGLAKGAKTAASKKRPAGGLAKGAKAVVSKKRPASGLAKGAKAVVSKKRPTKSLAKGPKAAASKKRPATGLAKGAKAAASKKRPATGLAKGAKAVVSKKRPATGLAKGAKTAASTKRPARKQFPVSSASKKKVSFPTSSKKGGNASLKKSVIPKKVTTPSVAKKVNAPLAAAKAASKANVPAPQRQNSAKVPVAKTVKKGRL